MLINIIKLHDHHFTLLLSTLLHSFSLLICISLAAAQSWSSHLDSLQPTAKQVSLFYFISIHPIVIESNIAFILLHSSHAPSHRRVVWSHSKWAVVISQPALNPSYVSLPPSLSKPSRTHIVIAPEPIIYRSDSISTKLTVPPLHVIPSIIYFLNHHNLILPCLHQQYHVYQVQLAYNLGFRPFINRSHA